MPFCTELDLQQPDRQQYSCLEGGVVLDPVGGLVAGFGVLGFPHVLRLTAWAWLCAAKPMIYSNQDSQEKPITSH